MNLFWNQIQTRFKVIGSAHWSILIPPYIGAGYRTVVWSCFPSVLVTLWILFMILTNINNWMLFFLSSVLQILKPIKTCIAASNRKSKEGLKIKENLLLWADIRFVALNVILLWLRSWINIYYIRKSQKHFDNGYRRFVTSEGQMLIF